MKSQKESIRTIIRNKNIRRGHAAFDFAQN